MKELTADEREQIYLLDTLIGELNVLKQIVLESDSTGDQLEELHNLYMTEERLKSGINTLRRIIHKMA